MTSYGSLPYGLPYDLLGPCQVLNFVQYTKPPSLIWSYSCCHFVSIAFFLSADLRFHGDSVPPSHLLEVRMECFILDEDNIYRIRPLDPNDPDGDYSVSTR